jgi:hypothetical protein
MKQRKRFIFGMMMAVLPFALLFSGCPTDTTSTTETTDTTSAPDKGLNGDRTNGTILFSPDGSFASRVAKANLAKGAKFSFFGYDWRVVAVNDSTATFWMDAPYTTSMFTTVIAFGDVQDENNTWNNGYYGATWENKALGTSAVRMLLINAASTIIGSKAGSDKVIAGAVPGINEENTTKVVYDIYYRKRSLDDVKYVGAGQSVTINYSIGPDDKLWLPSYAEVRDDGLWKLSNIDRNWRNTANGAFAWLRTPFVGNKDHLANNCDSLMVGYSTTIGESKDYQSIYFDYVNEVNGVRPAIHLDITTLK